MANSCCTRTAISSPHDSDLRTALWVAYRLSGAEIEAGGGKDRVNCFRKDPRMTRAETATTTDYNEPRFDQGHMANDRDLKDVLQEQVNTYIMSNMSPQEDCFNRGIWLSLEHQVRRWARAYGEVYVTSGAIFDRNGDGIRDADDEAQRMISRNGQSRVAVPTHYYKVVWRHEGGPYPVDRADAGAHRSDLRFEMDGCPTPRPGLDHGYRDHRAARRRDAPSFSLPCPRGPGEKRRGLDPKQGDDKQFFQALHANELASIRN